MVFSWVRRNPSLYFFQISGCSRCNNQLL